MIGHYNTGDFSRVKSAAVTETMISAVEKTQNYKKKVTLKDGKNTFQLKHMTHTNVQPIYLFLKEWICGLVATCISL